MSGVEVCWGGARPRSRSVQQSEEQLQDTINFGDSGMLSQHKIWGGVTFQGWWGLCAPLDPAQRLPLESTGRAPAALKLPPCIPPNVFTFCGLIPRNKTEQSTYK